MTSTFEKRKLTSIVLLAKLEDQQIFGLIEQILLSTKKKDWGEDLPEEDIKAIKKGIKDAEKGNVEDYDTFNRLPNQG